ncbi:bifunctional pantoate--beta-alanine ligase/(d)CMP kinase [Gloeothece verrucosa]|uniref:Bifunctional pantoate ligase/cytidylate kinase n=1 Tax=Gloeothece verrucosa (strain PCC 7822) TaxID=497965 RepID=E0UBB4_GLOV7|nr:bifunctional pantoate--beta-alanine ligase/(d)CMP kinase [Gloeothece verrucosa]ADN17470.1 pantoate/beta-alanine ligase [Gloeothece verrucosa PCC 7822]
MRLFTTVAGLRSYLKSQRDNKTVGLVPTMGALHIGHQSLIERARVETEIVVVSIFVNPLQFTPTEDLQKYPRQLQQDSELCEKLGVDVIFAPSPEVMGMGENSNTSSSSQTTTVIPPATLTSGLCGQFRQGHFQGVATIVTKLFNIVNPDQAYFGEKDAQQLAIIRRIVEDLNIPVEIRGCPIIREPSGLACSSRNQYLTSEQKEQAAVLYRSLQWAKQAFIQGEIATEPLIQIVKQELASVPEIKIQYVELVHPNSLTPLLSIDESGLLAIACYLGATRLIDNIILRNRKPIIAIDGPAGAGKSTVTRRVAQQLGLMYLDTGAMYRAITWLVLNSNINLDDEAAIAELVSQVSLELTPQQIKINGQDVTEAIRTLQVTASVSAISAQGAVRRELVKQQQGYGQKGGVVAEGRDIGTHVFPHAELKIFLTASVQERAKRRLQDLIHAGEKQITITQLEQDIQLRDYRDSHRQIAPLQKAADAIEIITDGLTIEDVTAKIVSLYQEAINPKQF